MIDELNHRVKNTLAIVQSVAHQTFLSDAVTMAARSAFEGRLQALAAAHNILTRRNWAPTELRTVVKESLRAIDAGRLSFKGPPIELSPKMAVTFAMALHELATNAMKYGALSRPEGRVAIDWNLAGDRLRLAWTETNGPEVSPPERRGFGSMMIEQALAAELQGEVKLHFLSGGLVCAIDAPAPQSAFEGVLNVS